MLQLLMCEFEIGGITYETYESFTGRRISTEIIGSDFGDF